MTPEARPERTSAAPAHPLASRPRVADADDVTRYVGGAHFDPATSQLSASAFDRSPKDVDGLSVNRVGLFSVDRDADRATLRRVMASRIKPGRTAIFAQLNVGAALRALASFGEDLFVCQDPRDAEHGGLANPAHALVVGLPFKGETVGSLRAEEAGDRLRALVHDRFAARDG